LEEKKLQLKRLDSPNGDLEIIYDKLIFSKNSSKVFANKRYYTVSKIPLLDSISFVVIDLNSTKEREYKFPQGIWGGELLKHLYLTIIIFYATKHGLMKEVLVSGSLWEILVY